jgi:hypothetical protein
MKLLFLEEYAGEDVIEFQVSDTSFASCWIKQDETMPYPPF